VTPRRTLAVVAYDGYSTLRFERDGNIGWLRLDRPDRLNSFTIEMWRELRALGAQLVDDAELRALVVAGEGRAFSSGIDTSVFTGGSDNDLGAGDDAGSRHQDPQVDAIMRTQDAYTWLAEAPYPTIAAVHGYALGAGLQIALACDIRVFARGTQVGLLEHKYGILPDLGGTQRLPRLIGPGKAKELIWTAARIDAEEAYRIGLCEQLVDDDVATHAGALAVTIAAQPPLAVRGAKRAVDAAGVLPVREGLVVEAEAQAVCLASKDMREAITAFVEKRPAQYSAT
jgi:enoyl-CoA hydratase/carnithine racemase